MFCSRKMNRKINHLHERSLRLVYNDSKSSLRQLIIKDNSVSIHHRNIQNVAILMFKVKRDLCPHFVRELFTPIQSHTRSNAEFLRPRVNTVTKGDLSLRHFAPIVWNTMVPHDIRAITDLNEFKKNIRTWTPIHCKCKLCKEYVVDLGFVTTCD